MGKINILDKHVAELIAAGEVVERPCSVVKELVENSIDSGAKKITVEIKKGGVTYIRVSDDGCGIEKCDVKNAFLRNATSKVKSEKDLNNIITLGFRGEALFSICAVSKVEVLTKPEAQNHGVRYVIEGGEEVSLSDYGCTKGTTVIVRNLFFNTPARMKFLKTDSSEGAAVAKILDKIVLSHPEISFKFIKNGVQELNSPGNGKIKDTIYSIYGNNFCESLIKLDYNLNNIKISGYISKPTNARATRNMQNFFVNGRSVKCLTAVTALEEAFKGSIMTQKFPSCVMYIDVPCNFVDVNVHPSKIEVKFVNDRAIFDAIYYGVKTALLEGDISALSPVIVKNDISDKIIIKNEKIKFINNKKNVAEDFADNNCGDSTLKQKSDNLDTINSNCNNTKKDLLNINNIFCENNDAEIKLSDINENKFNDIKIESQSHIENTGDFFKENDNNKVKIGKNLVKNNNPEFRFHMNHNNINIQKNNKILEKINKNNNLNTENDENQQTNINNQIKFQIDKEQNIDIKCEIFNTYIIVEKNKEELILIDKHAAHERLIYEYLKSHNFSTDSQTFLEPIILNLSKDEYSALINNLSLFDSVGFDINDFGNNSIIVRSAPTYLDNNHINEVVLQIVEHILNNKKSIISDHMEWLYENIACRAAVKAGNKTTLEEMKFLINKIVQKNIKYCPHGRPVAITIKKSNIEKHFGRV